MSFNFTPLSDEEIDAINLIDPGIYNFSVVKSTRKLSKSGNHMAELQLSIWDMAGKTHLIFDYLVFSNVPLNIRKVKHFCDAVGLQEDYKKGQLPEELNNFCGKAEVGIQEAQRNPSGGMYSKKNVVVDYVSATEEKSTNISVGKQKDSTEFIDDELPF